MRVCIYILNLLVYTAYYRNWHLRQRIFTYYLSLNGVKRFPESITNCWWCNVVLFIFKMFCFQFEYVFAWYTFPGVLLNISRTDRLQRMTNKMFSFALYANKILAVFDYVYIRVMRAVFIFEFGSCQIYVEMWSLQPCATRASGSGRLSGHRCLYNNPQNHYMVALIKLFLIN